MDGSIDRLIPQVRILPPSGRPRRSREEHSEPHFSLEAGEEDENAQQREPSTTGHAHEEERPVGQAAEDEAGAHLDVTA